QHQFSVAWDGTLVYSSGGVPPRQLTWMDRSGQMLGAMSSAGRGLRTVAISPDGRTVASDSLQNNKAEVWLHDVARGTMSRFTFSSEGAGAMSPSWSPDGNDLTYTSFSGPNLATVMRKSLGGRGAPEAISGGWGNPPRAVNSQL